MRTLTAIALLACLALSHADTLTITPYDTFEKCTGTTLSTGATVNKLQAQTAQITSATCTQIGGTGAGIKITGTSAGFTAFKTYTNTDGTCATAETEALSTAITGTNTYGTCYALKTDNTVVTASGAPYVRLYWDASTSKIVVRAYDTQTACTTATASQTASTGATVNLLYNLASTAISSNTCTKIGTTGTNYLKAVFTSSAVSSFKTYGTDSTCAGTSIDVASGADSLAYGTCIAQAASGTNAAATASGSPYFKLTHNAASTTSAASMSFGVLALVALLIAALF